jgi:hypothetical protein
LLRVTRLAEGIDDAKVLEERNCALPELPNECPLDSTVRAARCLVHGLLARALGVWQRGAIAD